jgi:Tol biopolymer transport system component
VRWVVLTLAVAGAAVVGGCGDDDKNPAAAGVESGTLQQGKIAYAALAGDNFEIFAFASGGNPVNLTRDAGLDQRPVWSPDGNRLAFVSDRSGDTEIYLMEADGSGVVRLTERPGFDDEPVWSPTGDRIAFVADSGQGNLDIYVMGVDGSNILRLTNSAGIDYRPSWSPDGDQIVFVSNRDSDSEIFRVNADGTGQTRLTNNTAHDDWPSWSPEGAHIAFESNRDGISEIYRMQGNGTQQTRITDSSREVTTGVFQPRPSGRPLWSPDGQRLLFVGTRDDDGGELYWVTGDEEQAQIPNRLTVNNFIEVDYQWAPDGTQILYVGFTESGEGTLFVLDIDGAGVVRLLDGLASNPSWR